MKRLVPSLAAICIVAIASGTAWGVTGTLLPYATGFETGTFDDPWAATNGGTASFVTDQTPPDGSDQCLYISDSADLSIASGGVYSNVWWYTYTKVTGQSEDASPSIGNNVAAFLVESDGGIRAYSSNDWADVGSVTVPASGWVGFSVHLDYVNRKYDIYRTPTSYSYGDSFVKANTTVLHFNESASAQAHFEKFTAEGTTWLDEVALSAGNVVDDAIADENTPSNSVNTSIDIYLEEGFCGVLAKYFEPGDRTLDGKLGDALYGALVDGDRVFIRKAAGLWWELEHNGQNQDWTLNQAHGNTLDQITLEGSAGIYLKLDGTGTREPATVGAYNTLYQAEDQSLTQNAFALLAVPMDATRNLTISNGQTAMGLPPPAVGDRLYIVRTGGSVGYTFLICRTAGVWTDMATGGNANVTLVPGQAFWYFRNGATDNWDVNNASTGVY